MEVLLLDNHDSFTYNIAHIVRNIRDVNLQIIKSDHIDLKQIKKFERIIFSPGPDIPLKGNTMESILSEYKGRTPILGICLGLQAIFIYFGGKLQKLDEVVHGRTKIVSRTGVRSDLFNGLPEKFEAGLYHSWIADSNSVPEEIAVTAISDELRIMAIKHRTLNIEAVQFHPESIMTPCGSEIIENWIMKKHKLQIRPKLS